MRNFVKKILALAIILGMFGQIGVNSFANYELNIVKFNVSKSYSDLKIIKDGKKYISKIDNFISKIDDKKANILSERLLEIRNTKNIKKGTQIDLILTYIYFKLEERELLKKEQAKKDIFKNTLSDSDTKKVNAELVKIQKNLLKQGVSNFEKILGELEKYTNFEEKGNFKANVNIDHEMFGKGKFELKLKDYISKNSGFDAQFKTKIEAIIEATPKGEEEVKLELSAFIDYISKDQNYYVLLKNLKIIDDKGILELDSKIEKIKEIASKNKYIHFEDKNASEIINILKQFTPQNILKQGNSIVAKPLFTAYKKEGNKFYLVPSKYGCDTAKTLAKKFDPFNGNTCTTSQYQNLLDDIAETKVEIYIDFSDRKNTKIGFDANNIDDFVEKFNGDITFSEKYIEEINLILEPNQKEYPGELANFHFIKGKKLDAKIYADSGNVYLNLISTLDGANRFKTIDFNFKADDNFSSELTLKNRRITGKYSGKGYNSKYAGIISGRTNTSNKLSTLKITNQYIVLSSYNPIETNTTLEYSFGKYSIENIAKSNSVKSDLKASFKMNKNILSELNLDLQIFEKESSYDKNYKKTYTGEFLKVVDSNIELKNRNIKGETKIYVRNEEFLKITNNGRLEEDKFELNTKIEFKENPLKYILPVNGNSTDKKEEKLEVNFNIKTDTSSSRNNFNIYTDFKISDKKLIDIELDNKSIKTYKKVKILPPMPNETIKLEDVLNNPELY